ncbi:MAG: helix-turn-helix domain-containing protein [Candidatus Margulisbacteria bacterium]|jgi:transcriptional regulator with XRE-family HTH domain|nr:helix-turn-helix domain-containing protein [Candidatus Margulisiibacteriota bacterium]
MSGVNELKLHLAKRLKELRLKVGLSIEALANQLGIGFPNYLYLEKGTKGCPKLETLLKLADFYGVDLVYFFQDFAVPQKKLAPLKGRIATHKMLAEFQKLSADQQELHLHLLKSFNRKKSV